MEPRNLRRRLLTVAAVTATTLAATVTPASASEPPRSYIVVNVSTIDANGIVITDPAGVTGAARNLTTGQTFTPMNVLGTLIWQDLPDGAYKLQVGAGSGWAPIWWPGTYSEAASGTFTLDKDATGCSPAAIGPQGCYGVKFTTQVPQLRTVTGNVTNRSGQRIPAVPVTAGMTKEPATQFSATTDSGGQFFLSVPPGTYELSAPNGNRRATEVVDVSAATVARSLILLDPPSAPTNVQVSAGNSSAAAAWSAPADNGGTPVTGYLATATPGGASCTTTGQRSCTITGLRNATSYSVTVTATNAVGTSAASAASDPFEPGEAVPSAPRSVRAQAGSGMASVSWKPPATPRSSPATESPPIPVA